MTIGTKQVKQQSLMINNADVRRVKTRNLKNSVFHVILLGATFFGIIILGILLLKIISAGAGWLNWNFLTNFPSRFPEKAGIKSALVGSVWLISLTALFSFPLGVGTAIYLEEYTKQNWFSRLLQINIANLAGVPSIVYGMLGLAVFVRFFNLERSIIAGALTLTLLILPVIIVAAREAIKSVPNSLREGSLALGATKWQTVQGVVLPYALPGILTGTILALSRAIGEAAPLIIVGAVGYVAFLPAGMMDSYTALPVQIFNWISRPQAAFQNIAAAGIMVLLAVMLTANGLAIIIRNKYQHRMD